MTFPTPEPWSRDTADHVRDEVKRKESPASYFFSQGKALVLASQYFNDERLADHARGGVAIKHRHKIHLALFGQLMASFEYLLKDFIAKIIDATDILDEKIRKAKWIEIDSERILASRYVASTPGSVLLHPTLGWHYPEQVNQRYTELFQHQVIASAEIATVNRLWVLRHTVAHNAGYLTHHDASRIGAAHLAEKTVQIDSDFISAAFWSLCPISQRIATAVGDKVLVQWLTSVAASNDTYERDKEQYAVLKKLATYVDSRPTDLPEPTESDFHVDIGRL